MHKDRFIYDEASSKLTLRGVDHIPEAVFEFARSHRVSILDASDNPGLKYLPDHFHALQDLERAFFSNCGFEEVPPQLRACANLKMLAMKFCAIRRFDEDVLPRSMEWLILTGNAIQTLPHSIGKLDRLRKVALAGNPLIGLPNAMRACTNIELLRVSAADFKDPTPEWLFNLPKLAWFSDGGNPSSRLYPDLTNALPVFSWGQDIHLAEQIAQSPSSTVYAARLRNEDRLGALKVFNHGLASDGTARDDFYCSVLAGHHPHLREVWGRAIGHHEGRDVIVMALNPAGFKDLGKPPNFKTCTRDTFAQGSVLQPSFVKNVLLGVTRAMRHLHQKNIMHGDLYAHNIQADSNGHALVGDFGAATYYDPQDHGALRQRLDVRAFGYLIEDMRSLIDPNSSMKWRFVMHGLQERCQDTDINRMPDFENLESRLDLLPSV